MAPRRRPRSPGAGADRGADLDRIRVVRLPHLGNARGGLSRRDPDRGVHLWLSGAGPATVPRAGMAADDRCACGLLCGVARARTAGAAGDAERLTRLRAGARRDADHAAVRAAASPPGSRACRGAVHRFAGVSHGRPGDLCPISARHALRLAPAQCSGAVRAVERRDRERTYARRAAGCAACSRPMISSVARTSPNVWMKLISVPRCSSSVRAALASATMKVLKSCMAASRAEDSQHTLVSVPVMITVSMPRRRSSWVRLLALGRNAL